MAESRLPGLLPNDPQNCPSEAARWRIHDARLAGELATLERRYRSEGKPVKPLSGWAQNWAQPENHGFRRFSGITRNQLRGKLVWSHPPGSNRRPTDYESVALPAELGVPSGLRLKRSARFGTLLCDDNTMVIGPRLAVPIALAMLGSCRNPGPAAAID